METKHKILILDDDTDWLETCRDFLAQLPADGNPHRGFGRPRAGHARRAEVPRFDLRPENAAHGRLGFFHRPPPFSELRTVVLTGLEDDHFRSRAYALGVDLFWIKTDMQENSQMFLDCIESLLGREDADGFRDNHAGNLLDVIRMECLADNSSVLKITSGHLVAKMWFQHGELVDAAAEGADGEAAFRHFEMEVWHV